MSEDETQLLVDPEQRIIKQVTVEDAKAADKLFDDLMRNCSYTKKRIYKRI